jgi:hypothetical protein
VTIHRNSRVLLVFAALAMTSVVSAQPSSSPAMSMASAAPAVPKAAPQGVAVLAMDAARNEAFTLARAVYASSLRPRGLDELHARILAGDPAPAGASKEVRELAELRASITGEDAASRRLLSSIAEQVHVQALLVIRRAPARPPSEDENRPEAPKQTPEARDDAGAKVAAEDAGAPGDAGAAAPAAPPATTASVMARLFLADVGDFDAARYEPDESGGWRGTVTSLSSRFPPPAAAPAGQLPPPPPRISAEGKESKPFYASPWFWGAIGAAALVGGFFFLASQDTSGEPIHLEMKVPR